MLSKIYVGNLPPETSEGSVRNLFTENGVNATHIQVKRGGYAFVDCADQNELDKAIEQLNGCQYEGHSIIVEPSVAGGGPKSKMLETRVRVSGVPVQALDEDLENLLSSVGEVQKCEKYVSRDGQTQVVQVSYVSADSAKEAASTLNGSAFEGGSLRVERIMDRRPRNTRQTGNSMDRRLGGSPLPQRHTEFPLRILVLSEMVGAIIGRQGATIRAITQQSRARVDVHRKDNAGSLEKAITIYGNPDNCTSACKRILEVMQEEANTINKGEVPLKILAHNNLIGRIIGKGGATIKKIMEDTNTRITVSSINDISNFNLERIITIKGDLDGISKAESSISNKLRTSYESDLQAYAPQSAMFPGLHPMAMMSTVGFGLQRNTGPSMGGGGGGGSSGMYGSGGGGGGSSGGQMSHQMPPMYPGHMHQGPMGGGGGMSSHPSSDGGYDTLQEHIYLYIPNSSVGALIGTRGSHIRNLIRFSGASVKIAPLEETKGMQNGEIQERRVAVVGTAEAQWKAQYLIFEKIREEGYSVGLDDVRLTLEMSVPSAQVGRIIGKGGQNVRDLQRQTGSIIKLPQQGSQTEEDTTVQIYGPFFSIQSAQRRIRSIIQPSHYPMGSRGGRPLTPRM